MIFLYPKVKRNADDTYSIKLERGAEKIVVEIMTISIIDQEIDVKINIPKSANVKKISDCINKIFKMEQKKALQEEIIEFFRKNPHLIPIGLTDQLD